VLEKPNLASFIELPYGLNVSLFLSFWFRNGFRSDLIFSLPLHEEIECMNASLPCGFFLQDNFAVFGCRLSL
jgi:hypothetical protein